MYILHSFVSLLFTSNTTSVFTPSQPAFTCSILTVETLEQGVKHIQS